MHFPNTVTAFLLFFLLLGQTELSLGQNATRGIFIVSAASKTPIQNASVQSEDLTFSALADNQGFVNLQSLPRSATALSVTAIGFETKIVSYGNLNSIAAHGIIFLEPGISSLTEVTVSSSQGSQVFKPISDIDIHLRPVSNSQEVLRTVPGLFIGQHAGGGKAEQIFLRGFDLDHGTDIHITVDGLPVNMVSHAHGQGYADLHFVIPEFIDKVNFNKGPYFADKGNFTTAGFVAFKTKDYLDKNFVKVEGGQFGKVRAVTGLNLLRPKKERRAQSLYLAGEGSFTKGFFESSQDFSRFNGTMKYHGNVSSNSTLTSTLSAFTSQWQASGQIPDRAVQSGMVGYFGAIDNTEGGNTSRYNANFQLSSKLNDGAVISNQLFYSRYKFELYSNFTFFKEDTANGDQIRQKENRNIFGYNGSYTKQFIVANIKTVTKAGLQLRHDNVNDLELTRTKNRIFNTDRIMLGKVNEWNAGAYWSQQFSVSDRLEITGGLRADKFINRYDDSLNAQRLSSRATIISPKLNISYRADDKLQLYLYTGKGFHSNDTRVAVQQNDTDVLPAAYGTDLGVVFKPAPKVMIQTALWYLWLAQEFVYVGDEGIVEPGGKTRRYGIDMSVRYEVLKNLYVDVDVSVTNPQAIGLPKSNSYLPLAPRFSSVGGLTYKQQYGLNGSLRYRYMGDRPANEDNSSIAKGYFVTDAAVHYTSKKWEAGLSVQNLFDVRWKETQFDTESRLKNEQTAVSEIHFTPGSPFFATLAVSIFF